MEPGSGGGQQDKTAKDWAWRRPSLWRWRKPATKSSAKCKASKKEESSEDEMSLCSCGQHATLLPVRTCVFPYASGLCDCEYCAEHAGTNPLYCQCHEVWEQEQDQEPLCGECASEAQDETKSHHSK